MLIVLSVVLMGLNVWFMSIIKSKNNQPPSRWISVLLQSWIAKILCVNAPKSFVSRCCSTFAWNWNNVFSRTLCSIISYQGKFKFMIIILMNYFCLLQERFSNDEALTSPLDDHDEIRKPVAPTISNQARNPWLYFFQMVDRTAFAVSVIVLTSFIITASV